MQLKKRKKILLKRECVDNCLNISTGEIKMSIVTMYTKVQKFNEAKHKYFIFYIIYLNYLYAVVDSF